MTQRAMALDAEAARITLESRAPAPMSAPAKTTAVVRSFWEGMFVVLTLGIGWIWLRRRAV